MVAEIKQSLHLDVGADGIATLTIDVPGHPVNTLTEQLGIEMADVLTRIERDPAIAAVVITGKPTGFLAGADLNMLRGFKTAAPATAAPRGAQLPMARIAALRQPLG